MAKLVTRMRWLQHERNIGELHQNNLARNVVAKKQFRKEKASRIDFPPNEKAPRNIFPFRPPATKIRIPHPPSIRHLAWFFNSSAAKLCQGEERLTNMIVSGHPLNLPKGRIIHFESYQCVSKLREYRSTWIRFQLAKWKKNIGVVQMSKWSNLKFKNKVQKSQHLLNIGKKTDPMIIHQSQKFLDGIPSLDPMRRQPVVKFIAKVQGVVTPAWSHRKLQEIEGVLVDLGGANQHFVLL